MLICNGVSGFESRPLRQLNQFPVPFWTSRPPPERARYSRKTSASHAEMGTVRWPGQSWADRSERPSSTTFARYGTRASAHPGARLTNRVLKCHRERTRDTQYSSLCQLERSGALKDHLQLNLATDISVRRLLALYALQLGEALHDVGGDVFRIESIGKMWGGSNWMDLLSGKADPMRDLFVLAAGAKAELVCLGITQSAGFGHDRATINQLRLMWESRCSEAYWKTLFPPGHALTEALDKIPEYKVKLEELVADIDCGYARTVACIREHRNILELFESEAHQNLETVGTGNLADGTVLLSAQRMREIWENT
jgi:hypothetical protein